MAKPKRHPVQIDEQLWSRLVADAARQQRLRKKVVTPAQRAREIISEALNRKG